MMYGFLRPSGFHSLCLWKGTVTRPPLPSIPWPLLMSLQAITTLSLLQALTITSAASPAPSLRGRLRHRAATSSQTTNPAATAMPTPLSASLIWPEALRCLTSVAPIQSLDSADSNYNLHTITPSDVKPKGWRRSFSCSPPLAPALDLLPPLPNLVSLELNGYGSTGIEQLPGSFMARLRRLALIGVADATPLQAHWSELRNLSDLVLDDCVGVEPLLATLSDLQVRGGSIDLNPTFKIVSHWALTPGLTPGLNFPHLLSH